MAEQKLDLSVPEAGAPRTRSSGRPAWMLWLILVAAIANIVILLTGPPRRGPVAGSSGDLRPENLKQLAMKLEKQGLHTVAAEAWKEYLNAAGLKGGDAARIWYRIGVICQDGEEYERALDSYYRSESCAKLAGLDLEIARRTQECLETLGKFAALRHALDERVGIGKEAGKDASVVVAEIGPMKITLSELDRRIEDYLESRLQRLASVLSEEQRKERKEEMLSELSSSSQRLQILNQFLFEELLYREARNSEMAAKPEVRRMLRDQERSLLAARVIERDVMEQIRITSADVEDYYSAHESEFVERDEEGVENQKTLDEVRGEIYGILRAQEEQNLQQRLLEKLMSKYDVVIHHAAFGAGEAKKNDG